MNSSLLTRGMEELSEAGLSLRLVDPRTIDLSKDDATWHRFKVMSGVRPPTPSMIERDLLAVDHDSRILYLIPRASATLRSFARINPRVGFVACDEGEISIEFFSASAKAKVPSKQAKTRGRMPWVRFGVIRMLALTGRSMTQIEVARRMGVTQAAVSIAMSHLGEQVTRDSLGWRARSRERMWDTFMADYPGPGGLARYWLGTGEPHVQLERIVRANPAPAPEDGPLLVSGDLAADYYAPWRRPTAITVYTTEDLPLDRYGFASVKPQDASVEVRIPADPTISRMARRWETSGANDEIHVPDILVDPLIAAWDLRRTSGTDVDEALGELRARSIRMGDWWEG